METDLAAVAMSLSAASVKARPAGWPAAAQFPLAPLPPLGSSSPVTTGEGVGEVVEASNVGEGVVPEARSVGEGVVHSPCGQFDREATPKQLMEQRVVVVERCRAVTGSGCNGGAVSLCRLNAKHLSW